MKKISSYKFGILAEKIAILFLLLKGYKILRRRHKNRFGEIDIIARKSNILVIIEVKARSKEISVEEILHQRQIERIKLSAQFFVAQNKQLQNCDLRFDFIKLNKFFIPKHYQNFIS